MAAKVQIKNEKYMPYGGIYFVIREFLLKMAPIIDGYLGFRSKLFGYQYSEISLAMLCNFLCGGDRTEDIYHIHDMIEQKPGLRICSPDTVLRAMTELSVDDTVYTSDSGREYRFNTADRIRHARVDCGSYSKEVVRLLLEHSRRIFVRAEMTRTLRGKLHAPGLQWRKVEMNCQQIEVTSLPFDGLDGEIKGCRLVVQRQHNAYAALYANYT